MRTSVLFILLMISGTIPVFSQNSLKIDDDIQLIHLKDSVFVHITWDETKDFGRFSSNGMILVRNGRAIMVDTPTDDEKTKKLVCFLKDSMNVITEKLLIGHFHNDCLGGLGYIKKSGIESFANILTSDKCRELGLPVPDTSFKDLLVINFYGEKVICCYFGKGHSADNITVYIPGENILFGGCLIRPMEANNLGNISDAYPEEWGETVSRIIEKYKGLEYVIPGHGEYGGAELLHHTVKIAVDTTKD